MNAPSRSNRTHKRWRLPPGSSWLLPFLLLSAPPLTLQAQFIYTINNGAVTITGYTGPIGAVIIPDSIAGFPVTAIGANAFYHCNILTDVTIPNRVINIGNSAFSGCLFLTRVTIGTRVTVIGDNAFNDCERLTSVMLPDSVTSIGNSAFYQCFNLTNIATGSGLASIGDAAFMYCEKLTSLRLPQSVTHIGDSACYGCYVLTSLNVPDSITWIPWRLCYFCYNLRQLTISTNATYIDQEAFRFCTSLTSVSLPESVTNLQNFAFSDCASLTNVELKGVVWLGNSAFARCSQLGSVTVPDSVTTIDAFAFYQCSNLTNVRIGCGVTDIIYWAFKDCTRLKDVYFLGNAPNLGPSVFEDDLLATIYYLPATSGWGLTYGGRPTVLWNVPPPIIHRAPLSQTAEAGSEVLFKVQATNALPLWYAWFFNQTNLLARSKSPNLQLNNVQLAQSGDYTVVATNGTGTVTSAPAELEVIAPVVRRPVPALNLMGQPGTMMNLDFTSALAPAPLWTTFDHVTLPSAPQWYFDLSSPLPPQGFYRAWHSEVAPQPTLALHVVPAITLTGTIGSSLRVDYINQFGSPNAWFTLATVTLTNTTQLYFDTSAIGQPPRLWRIVPVP
jgi:hypothetical protein